MTPPATAVPGLSLSDSLYTLREHIAVVRERIRRPGSPPTTS